MRFSGMLSGEGRTWSSHWLARWPLLLLAASWLLFAIAFAAGWVRLPTSVAAEYRLGVEAFNRGKEALRADRVFHDEAEGQEAERFARAQFRQAEWHFERCILAGSREYKVFFARGHARLRQNHYLVALADFQQANDCRQPAGDAASRFCMAYCFACLDRHLEAISVYTQAIETGYNAAAYNNRAFCRLRRGAGNQNLKDAASDLDEAVRRDPNLPAARYNRALLALQRRVHNPNTLLSDTALADIRIALDTSPAMTRELYRDAAYLYAFAILDDSRRRIALSVPAGFAHADLIRQGALCTLPDLPLAALAVECVERAVAEGEAPRVFAWDLLIGETLVKQPAFQQLLRLQPGTRSTPPGAQLGTRLVEPDSQLPG
jgi:tetratricopeptide (TPR) repeat protein